MIDKPVLNNIVKTIHTFIESKIIDIPDLTPEQKRKVYLVMKDIVVEVASESLAKIADDNIDKIGGGL